MLLKRAEYVLDGLLDAEVDDAVAVVGEDDVNEVLADVVHVALDGCEHHRPLRRRAALLLHEGFEEAHSRLHHFRRLQDEGQLHLAAAEKIAHGLHAVEQNVVDDVERGIIFEREFQVVFELLLLAVNDVMLESLLDGQVARVLLDRLRRDALEELCELCERVVHANVAVEAAAVVDEVARDFQFAFADAVQGNDLAGVDDGRVEARFDSVVKEDRVQSDARRRTQAERDVRDAEQCEAARKLPFDAAYALDGFERVAAVFFDAPLDGGREAG